MKKSNDHGGNFEEKLLEELKNVVAQRGVEEEDPVDARRRPPVRGRAAHLALGAAVVVAAAVTVLVFNSGGANAPAAFAVEPQDGGGTTIKIYSPEDGPGLAAALEEAGIRSQVTWLPAGMACREPHFKPSTAKTALGGTIGGFSIAGPGPAMTIGVMTRAQYREHRREFKRGEMTETEFLALTGSVTLDPTQLRPDQSVVISGAPGPSPALNVIVNGAKGPFKVDPEGGYEAHLAIAEGAVEPCEPIAVPKGKSMLRQIIRMLEAEAAEHGAAPEGADAAGSAGSSSPE